MSNIDVPMVMVLLSYFSMYGTWRMDVPTDVCTYGCTDVDADSRVTTKNSEIDGLPNFLRYGAPLMRLWCSGAPLFKD